MVRTRMKALFAILLSFLVALGIAAMPAFADSSTTIVTLGADLDSDERAEVLEFFGLTEDDLEDMTVITVTNSDEREYLEGTLSDDIIGYQTMSCSYIQITDSGGINVETANLNYVTSDIIYNALQTAGIENCNVVVTAPFEVSGTGALTGIFLAFESEGTDLDEDKKEAATEELVTTAELEDEYGSDIAEVISDVKNEVTSSDDDLSSDEISELIEETASDYGISLSEDDLATLTSLIEAIQSLDYDTNVFANTLSSLSESSSGILASIASFFQSIIDFFSDLISNLTGGDSDDDDADDSSESILDDLNTDVYELDDDSTTSTSESASDESDSSDADASDTSSDDAAIANDTGVESDDSSSDTDDASADAASTEEVETVDDASAE